MSTPLLITLDQAKAHLRMDHDAEDETIESYIRSASRAVLTYLGDAADEFLDSSGEVVVDSSNLPVTPEDIQHAVRLLVGEFMRNREPEPGDQVNPSFGYGYLPRAVTALLYPYRTPMTK